MKPTWNDDISRILLMQELIRKTWLKALDEELGDSAGIQRTHRLIEVVSEFLGGSVFKENVERNKGLEDNIQAVLKFKIANPPRPKVLEAFARFWYGAAPADFDHWSEQDWRDLAYWQRFQEEFGPLISARLREELTSGMLEMELRALPNTGAQAPDGPLPFRLGPIDLLSLKQSSFAFLAFFVVVIAAGFLACALLPVGNWLHQPASLPDKAAITGELAFSIIQAILLPLLLFLVYFAEGTEEKISSLPEGIVRQTLEQFRVGWIGFWISMCALYLWFSLKWGFMLWRADADPQAASGFLHLSWVVSDFINLCGAFFLFYIFYILDTPSIAYRNIPERNASFKQTIRTVIGIGLLLFAGGVYDRLNGSSIFVFSLSIFHAMGLAMLVSRLSSHFFTYHRWVLPFLFLYAAIQAGWPALSQTEPGNLYLGFILVLLALILKGILLWDISYKIRQDDFAGYITAMNRIISSRKQINE